MDKENKKIIFTGSILALSFFLLQAILYLLGTLGVNLSRNHLGDLPGILQFVSLASLVALPVGIFLILFGVIKFLANKRKNNV